MGDYWVGLVQNPRLQLAVAVGVSSAFPPFLSPVDSECLAHVPLGRGADDFRVSENALLSFLPVQPLDSVFDLHMVLRNAQLYGAFTCGAPDLTEGDRLYS
jgi:hypothetical protein